MRAIPNGSFHVMLHADCTLLSFSRAHVHAAPHLQKAEHGSTAAAGMTCTLNLAIIASLSTQALSEHPDSKEFAV